MDLAIKAAEAYLETAEDVPQDDPGALRRLRFLKGLWEIQSEAAGQPDPYAPPEEAEAMAALAAGQPLFWVRPPETPASRYVDAAARIAAYVSENAALPQAHAEALLAVDFAAALDGTALSSAVGSPQSFYALVARNLGVNGEGPLTAVTLSFVLASALVPFFVGPARAALAAVPASSRKSWTAGHCPVCGADAAMGRMGESSSLQGATRVLWCSACHSEWEYERLRCVRCGTRNPGVLRYTHLEKDPARRLHLCDECHGYAKFVFAGEVPGLVSMLAEDALSASLDAVAISKGYTA